MYSTVKVFFKCIQCVIYVINIGGPGLHFKSLGYPEKCISFEARLTVT